MTRCVSCDRHRLSVRDGLCDRCAVHRALQVAVYRMAHSAERVRLEREIRLRKN